MSDLGLADGPSDLTPEWLTAALSTAGVLDGAAVTDASAKSLGTGQMSDSFRVSVTYDSDTAAPTSLVAKLPSSDDTSRATAIALRNYEKEVRFYQEAAPRVALRLPRAYFAEVEPATGRFSLLLQDLSPAQQGDQIAGCDAATAAKALEQLALLHAPMWESPALTDMPWLGGYSDDESTFLKSLLPGLWSGFQDRYAADLDPEVVLAGTPLFDHIEEFLAPTTAPTTLIHQDYRVDNLLFSPDGDVVAVVDWQTCGVGAALSDVAYFLGSSLDPSERLSTESELVSGYFNHLVENGVDGYTRDNAERDYRRASFGGLLMAVGASMMVQRTDRGDAMFLAMAHRHSRHALDLDAAELLTS